MATKLNRTVFFSYVRRAPFGGKLDSSQIQGMNDILDEWESDHGDDPLAFLAYPLATAFHETGGRMVPVRECFGTSTKDTVAKLDNAWKKGQLASVREPYWCDGWFGRGRAQTTHLPNYTTVSRKFGIDCVNNPDLLLDSKVDAKVLLGGMQDGIWTGRKLKDYFHGDSLDALGARAIINGKDKASLIAGYCTAFLGALNAADTSTPLPTDVSEQQAQSDDIKPKDSAPLVTAGLTFATGGGLTAVTSINSPFALAGIGLLVAAGLLVFWLIGTGRITLNRM